MFTEGLFTGRYPSVAPCFKWPYPLAINNNNNISVLLLPSPYLVLLLSQWLLFCSIILAGYVRGLLDAPRCSEMLRDAPRCSGRTVLVYLEVMLESAVGSTSASGIQIDLRLICSRC